MGQLHRAGEAGGGGGDRTLEGVILEIDETGQGSDGQDPQHYDDQHQFYQGKAVACAFHHDMDPLITTNR